MTQSLAKVLVHLIFSTKNHTPYLAKKEWRDALNGYFVGILKNLKCPSLRVNAVTDHVHILCVLSRTVTLAELLEEVKKSSPKWIKTLDPSLAKFQWQAGYGAFSVSQSNVRAVTRYIANQEEHHRRVTFQEEFRNFVEKYQVEYDERYVWD